MKTVCDYFLEYYKAMAASAGSSEPVSAGIHAYLASIGLDGECENSERAAYRELARFRLMPLETFEAFFRSFEQREKVQALVKDCLLLARARYTTGECIAQEEYMAKMGLFYSLVTPLASDKACSGWISDESGTIEAYLKYASGKSDAVPAALRETVQ